MKTCPNCGYDLTEDAVWERTLETLRNIGKPKPRSVNDVRLGRWHPLDRPFTVYQPPVIQPQPHDPDRPRS